MGRWTQRSAAAGWQGGLKRDTELAAQGQCLPGTGTLPSCPRPCWALVGAHCGWTRGWHQVLGTALAGSLLLLLGWGGGAPLLGWIHSSNSLHLLTPASATTSSRSHQAGRSRQHCSPSAPAGMSSASPPLTPHTWRRCEPALTWAAHKLKYSESDVNRVLRSPRNTLLLMEPPARERSLGGPWCAG